MEYIHTKYRSIEYISWAQTKIKQMKLLSALPALSLPPPAAGRVYYMLDGGRKAEKKFRTLSTRPNDINHITFVGGKNHSDLFFYSIDFVVEATNKQTDEDKAPINTP